MQIRKFLFGEESALFDVYYSAIHLIACRDYTVEQINAWAPADLDQELWATKIRDINPFVVEFNGSPIGYADIQPSGYIDHFFVSGQYPRLGVGSMLMSMLHNEALRLGVTELSSNVSRTAQPFFAKHDFSVIEQRNPELRGVVIPNALMRKILQ